jgi:hypothetical protein
LSDVGGTPAGPVFSISDASATEGTAIVFTVTKTGSASGSLTVNYATANGTAIAGSDYSATSGTLTFTSAQTSKTVSIPTIDDSAVESAETLSLNLSNAAAGSSIGDGQGIGTINDNDTAVAPSFAVSDATITEGGSLVFTITKTGSTSSSFSVNYATANSSAIAGSDYTATSGTLTFTAAQTSKTVSVLTTDDTTVESAETMFVNLSGATGGSTISDSQGVGTINDNDTPPPPSFAVGDTSVTEGGSLAFTVTRTAGSGTFSVNYVTANSSAIAGSDYTATSGTLTFGTTQLSQIVSVPTTDDTAVESAETLFLNLSGATGGSTISDSQGIGTINDNDSAGTCSGVSFAVNDTSTSEGDPLVFTITKAGSASGSCSVSYATADGTAQGGTGIGARYVTAAGSLTFTSAQTSQTVSITTHFDNATRTDTMFLNLSGPSGGATLSDSQGVGTIQDAPF